MHRETYVSAADVLVPRQSLVSLGSKSATWAFEGDSPFHRIYRDLQGTIIAKVQIGSCDAWRQQYRTGSGGGQRHKSKVAADHDRKRLRKQKKEMGIKWVQKG